MYLTWLDSNSWLIELEGKRILLDPWLVGALMFGNAGWLFKGSRPTPRPIPTNIDLILLSQGLEDHAHPETLKALDHSIPVVGSASAAKVARNLGYASVTALAHGESLQLSDRLSVQAVPGSPIGPTTVENGYILRGQTDGSLYYEPHGFHSPMLRNMAPIDVVITPIINLELPLLGPIIQGKKTALELAKWLQPQVMLPTAAGGDIVFEGLLLSLLKAVGSAADMQQALIENHLPTQILEPKPGERLEVNVGIRV